MTVEYKRGSGQEVNVSKLGILFSKNTSEEDKKKSKGYSGNI